MMMMMMMMMMMSVSESWRKGFRIIPCSLRKVGQLFVFHSATLSLQK